jgi:hypothetical protein
VPAPAALRFPSASGRVRCRKMPRSCFKTLQRECQYATSSSSRYMRPAHDPAVRQSGTRSIWATGIARRRSSSSATRASPAEREHPAPLLPRLQPWDVTIPTIPHPAAQALRRGLSGREHDAGRRPKKVTSGSSLQQPPRENGGRPYGRTSLAEIYAEAGGARVTNWLQGQQAQDVDPDFAWGRSAVYYPDRTCAAKRVAGARTKAPTS